MKKTDIIEDNRNRIGFAVEHGLGEKKWELAGILSGMSGAVIYKIQVLDKFYVVKLEKFDDPNFNLVRNYEILATMSKEKLSPNVFFTDAQKGVVLMEFIDSSSRPEVSLASIEKFATLIRKVHDQKLFSNWMSVTQIVDHFYRQLTSDYQRATIVEKCTQELKTMEKIIFDPADIRSCHCDLNPSNLLFDGEQYILIDWQAASPQSFYFDLACCSTFFYFYNDDLCSSFLECYFGRKPTETEQAKYYLMRVFSLIYYGIIFISIPLNADKNYPILTDDAIEKLPTYVELMKAIGAGKANLADAATQQQFGFVLLRTALEKMIAKNFSESYKILGDGADSHSDRRND